jgi:hypothetical protein
MRPVRALKKELPDKRDVDESNRMETCGYCIQLGFKKGHESRDEEVNWCDKRIKELEESLYLCATSLDMAGLSDTIIYREAKELLKENDDE